jgi:hypothetical protein
MNIKDFETKIKKEIDPKLHIRYNANTDVNGVYWDTMYVGVALPPSTILDRSSQYYVDPHTNVPWRGVEEALSHIKARLPNTIKKHQDEQNEIPIY